MARFSDEWIEQVKSSVDLVKIVGRRVELKQSGRNYLGLCPFHDEKTPSFSVSPEGQFYHCFGCKKSGNAINFLMETEHLSFPEAVTRLAQEQGIPVPALSSQEEKRERKREELRQTNELAARFFYRNLRLPGSSVARSYLIGRGISPEVARHFYLGYASDEWDELIRFLESEGVDLKLAEEAGLISRGSQSYYDRFRNRIIFPICDHLGRFVGFGGRNLHSGQPKYLNTAQTLVFNKGFILYGLNWAKNEIKEQNLVIVVEGYTDLIALYSKGIKNVVAALGTAFTTQHAKLLSRFANQVTIAFDGDTAGQRATLRSMGVLRENGLQVKVAVPGEGQDPDDFVRSKSDKDVAQWLFSARPFLEYQIDRIISQHDVETREGKLTASNELVSMLAELDNAIERDEYIRYGAQRLGVAGQSLASDVDQKMSIDLSRPVQNRHNMAVEPSLPPIIGDELVERELLRSLLKNPNNVQLLHRAKISAVDFLHPDYRYLFVLLNQNQSDQRGTAIADGLYRLADPTGSFEDYLNSFLLVVQKRRLQKMEEKLSLLENYREGSDVHLELYRLLKEYYDILSMEF